MKQNAWTLMELFIALIIIAVISSIGMTVFRPDTQKAKFYVYGVINNLTKGNIALLEKHNTLNGIAPMGEGANVNISMTKIGDTFWTTRNAGDPGGPELPSSVKICAPGQDCTYSSSTPICWKGTTSSTCTNKTGYSGCNRTVCNWYAANIICPHNGMDLPTTTQIASLRENPGSDSLYTQTSVDFCDHSNDSALYSRCLKSESCLGAANNYCFMSNIWGPSTGSKAYNYGMITGNLKGPLTYSQQYAFSVRCTTAIDNIDPYCIALADVYSLAKPANCSLSANKNDVNIEFPNGITIKGLASPWVKPYNEANFEYKNILVDIDGEEGKNKIWVDQFPLRIIGGTGKGVEGLIMPVNCKNEQIYNPSTEEMVNVSNAAKNPYCPSTNGKNYTIDDQVITYDIYKAKNKEGEKSPAEMIAAMVSPMEADCMAFGSARGYFSVSECDAAKIKISPKCATKESCATCTANTCPEGSTNAESCATLTETTNPDDITCIAIPHKPSGGVSFVVQSLMGNIDEF